MNTYVIFLRGINVGGNKKVEMKKLRSEFEKLGYTNVSTYINSGNVIFESQKKPETKFLEKFLKKIFGFEIRILIKTKSEMARIVKAIPEEWQNDPEQRTDVAYLFKEIDTAKIVDELPVNKEFVDICYIKGALFWNLKRKNLNKSRLGKLIGHKTYQNMTVRNVNTARFLAK